MLDRAQLKRLVELKANWENRSSPNDDLQSAWAGDYVRLLDFYAQDLIRTTDEVLTCTEEEEAKREARRGGYAFEKKASDHQAGGTHYKDMGVEPWAVIDTWPIEQQIGYHRGTILAYTMRLGNKGPSLGEAEKIAHCTAKLVEILGEKRDA